MLWRWGGAVFFVAPRPIKRRETLKAAETDGAGQAAEMFGEAEGDYLPHDEGGRTGERLLTRRRLGSRQKNQARSRCEGSILSFPFSCFGFQGVKRRFVNPHPAQ